MPQHDLVVDNASGAAFRADLNNALAALGSSMKGPNAPSAPTAGMVWVDDDTPSATVWTVKLYDGAEWIELGRLDITNNVYIPSEGVIAWVDVASAATVDLSAQASRSLRITGTTGIGSFGTAASGVRKRLRIATGLTITHNATSLICPGAANLVLGAGDTLDVESLGSGNWLVAQLQYATPAAARAAIIAEPLATNTAGVGQRITLNSGLGNALVLPAGGQWDVYVLSINASSQITSHLSSLAAGGTTYSLAAPGITHIGTAKRIA